MIARNSQIIYLFVKPLNLTELLQDLVVLCLCEFKCFFDFFFELNFESFLPIVDGFPEKSEVLSNPFELLVFRNYCLRLSFPCFVLNGFDANVLLVDVGVEHSNGVFYFPTSVIVRHYKVVASVVHHAVGAKRLPAVPAKVLYFLRRVDLAVNL